MPKRIIRAAVYARCSDPDLKDSPTLESQVKAAREHCRKEGYQLTEEHIYSEALSAFMLPYTQRKKLMELLKGAKRKEFDIVVVTEIRAVSRKQVEVFVIYDLLQKYNVRLETTQEKFEDSAMGRFILATRALVAELERENTYMRTMRGRQDRLENGCLRGHGKPLYGYRFIDVGKEKKAAYELNDAIIFVDAENTEWSEVKIVRFIYEEFLKGVTIRGIQSILNQKGVPTPGKPRKGIAYWQPGTIYKILTEPDYKGEAYVNKYKKEDGKLRRRLDEQMIRLPDGVCPPIVITKEYDDVQKKLEANKQDALRNNKHPQDLGLLRAGYAYCGICGRRLALKFHNPDSSRKNPRPPEYVCQTKTGKDEERVNHFTSITMPVLDRLAWEKALDVIGNPTLVRERITQLKESQKPLVDTEAVEEALRRVDKQMENLYKLAQSSEDDDTLASLIVMLKNLEKQKHDAEAMLLDARDDEEEARQLEEELQKFEEWALSVQPLLTDPTYEPTYEEKRLAVRILGLKAVVYPGKGDYPFRYQITVEPPEIVNSVQIHQS